MVLSLWQIANAADERFWLLRQVHYKNRKESKAVYFDRVQQRVVVQNVEWSESYDRHRKDTGANRYVFPEATHSLARESHRNLEKTFGIDIDYDYYPLSTRNGFANAQSDLGRLIGKEASKFVLREVEAELDTAEKSKYKLLGKGMHSNRQLAIYYNEEKGDFVLKGVKRKNQNDPVYPFPENIGLAMKAGSNKNGFSINTDKTWAAKTPREFDKALENIIDYFDDYKYTFSSGNSFFSSDKGLAKLKEMLQQKKREFEQNLATNFDLVRNVLIDDDDDNWSREYCHKMYYSYKSNEMYWQKTKARYDKKTKRKVCEKKILSDKMFDLSDENGFKSAQRHLSNEGVYNSTLFENFRNLVIPNCEKTITSYLLPEISNHKSYLERIWGQYFDSALAPNALKQPGRKMSLQVNIKDEKVQVVVQLDKRGNIIDLKFKDPSVEKKLGIKIKIGHKDGQRLFTVVTEDEIHGDPKDDSDDEILMTFGTDDVGITEGAVTGKLAVHVLGGGSAQKNTYDFKYGKRSGDLESIGPRKQVTGDRVNLYNVPIAPGSGGGFENFMFKTFWSKKGRQKYVRDEVRERATETLYGSGGGTASPYANLITRQRIKEIADEVSRELKVPTRNYSTSTNHISASAARLTLNKFVDEMVPKMLEEYVAAEDPASIKKIISTAVNPFKHCLYAAEKKQNVEESMSCMTKLSVQAPVDIGEGILQLKLADADMADFAQIASKEYHACLKTKYYPNFLNARNEIDQKLVDAFEKKNGGGLTVVKGCLYTSVLKIVDQAGPEVIDKELLAMEKAQGFSLSLTRKQKVEAFNNANTCLKKKKLSTKASYGIDVNFANLRSLDPDDFQQDLFSCLDLVKRDIGRIVASTVLDDKLKDMGDFPDSVKAIIKKEAIDSAYDSCNDKQLKIIADRVTAYRAKKKQMAAAGKRGAVDVFVPEFNPAACLGQIMNQSVAAAAKEIITLEIGKDNFAKLTKGTIPEFEKCFEKVNQKIIAEMPAALETDSKVSADQATQNQKVRDAGYEKDTSLCLVKAIVWAGDKGSKFMIQKILASKGDEFAAIKFGDEEAKVTSAKIAKCFEKNLAGKHTLEDVTGTFGPLKDLCGAELLKDPAVQDVFIRPMLNDVLSKTGMTKEQIADVADGIVFSLNVKIKDKKSIDEVINTINETKPEIVLDVVNKVLDFKILDFVDEEDPVKKAQIVKELRKVAKEQVLRDLGYTEKLRAAVMSPDKTALDRVIGDLKLDAIKVLAPIVIQKMGEDFKKKGMFSSQEEIDRLKAKAKDAFDLCLKEKTDIEIGKRTDDCLHNMKIETAVWVVDDQLKTTLTDPELGRYFSEEEVAKIRNDIAGPKLRADFDRVFKITDKKKAKDELAFLVTRIKVDGVKKVAPVIFPRIVDEFMPVPKTLTPSLTRAFVANRTKIKKEIVDTLDTCYSLHIKRAEDFYTKGKSTPGYDPDEDGNACLNRARRTAFEKIMPARMRHILNLLTTNESGHAKHILNAEQNFKTCMDKLKIGLETSLFAASTESCMISTIRGFSKSVVVYARDLVSDDLSKRRETDLDFGQCLEDADKYISKMHGGNVPTGTEAEKVALYTKAIIDTKKNPIGPKRFNIANYLEELRGCAFSSLAENLLEEYRDSLVMTKKLPAKHEDLVNHLVKEFGTIFSTKDPSGRPFHLTFMLFKDNAQKNSEAVIQKDGGAKGVLDVFEEVNGLVLTYIDLAAEYGADSGSIKAAITKFRKAIVERINANGGTIDIKEINQILVDSELASIIIEAGIANKIALKSKDPLTEQGVSAKNQKAIMSEPLLRRVFRHGKEGKALVDDIKNNWMLPLLNGELTGQPKDMPKKYETKVLEVLLDNDKPYGFVETIFNDIVQKGLTEKRDYVEGTWYHALYRIPVAVVWYGRNRNDFVWGPPKNLRLTCSGHKAVKAFSKYFLKPMMLEEKVFSDKQVEELTAKHITPLLEKAMDEKPVGNFDKCP